MKDLLKYDVNDGKVIYQSKIHWTSFMFPILFTVVGFLIAILMLLIKWIGISFFIFSVLFVFSLRRFLRLISTKIYVTEKQLTIIYGIFSKNVIDISLRKYEGMRLTQSFLGRILNFGKLTVSTGEITKSYKVDAPVNLRKAIIEFKPNS